jgi:two-component system, chemotaxis family, CheB/CheR fusion protein
MAAGDGLDFPIAGIGASAGGVEALEGFFSGMPSKPGLGFVIVTHLGPERESMLHQIVARYTELPVNIAADGISVEIDNIYVLPADAILSIENRRLRIHKPGPGQRERKPIDIFFSALATDCGELAAGVVLSGGDGDGTLGIKAIKERGGLTLAQVADGHGPRYPDMPESAISTGLVDLAVPVNEMGAKLADFARSLAMLDGMVDSSRVADDQKALDEARREIYAILRSQVGHEFGGYKTKTFIRRVHRRMHIRQLETPEAYVELLRQEPAEVGALFRDLLINVTSFFRDVGAFESLAATVIPKLFDGRGADDILRIWVPGCATGEEVYSISILLREHMAQLSAVPRVQIFATDIDERALTVARAGRYPAALLENVSLERKERFFVPDGGSYVISKEVRDLCIFSPHSVIRDPPFSRIDLVSCRNLLIYFGLDVQHQVLPTFYYALRADGFLFLGTSESTSQFTDLFAPVDKKHRIFQRRSDVAAGIRQPTPVNGLRLGHVTQYHTQRIFLSGGGPLRHSIEAQVLEQFAPPYVVVDGEGNIVLYSARTGKYLEAAAGAPTRQILAIARKGLRLDLRTSLREAMESGRPVMREGIAIEGEEGRVQMITLTISPVSDRHGDNPLFLVLFADQGPALTREEALNRASISQDDAALHLERELRETRERLQSLIEEYETSVEELTSSNEELVSVNEELQSTNEELEASKEELQSVNEELHTVNSDLSIKIEALDCANNDLRNLFDSTDIATLFLDPDLVIRSFTPAVTNIFNILPSDRGRPLTDLSAQVGLPNLAEDIAATLSGRGPIERRLAHPNRNTHYLVRLGPYRDGDKKTVGIVLTFVDVTSLAQAEERQRLLLAEVQHRTRNLLAVVQSIAAQTVGRGGSVEDFSIRLAALGRVQNLIGQSTKDEIDLEEIVRLELEAHGSLSNNVTVSGPPVALNPDQVQALALALHELATNAVKYGALSGDDGRLRVSWIVEPDKQGNPLLSLTWRESGVVMPADTTRRGYGRRLIERSLNFSLRATTELNFGVDGVFCRIEVPLRMGNPAASGETG